MMFIAAVTGSIRSGLSKSIDIYINMKGEP